MIFANVQILFKWNANGQTINERFISFQEILYESIFAFVLILIILFVFFLSIFVRILYFIWDSSKYVWFDLLAMQCIFILFIVQERQREKYRETFGRRFVVYMNNLKIVCRHFNRRIELQQATNASTHFCCISKTNMSVSIVSFSNANDFLNLLTDRKGQNRLVCFFVRFEYVDKWFFFWLNASIAKLAVEHILSESQDFVRRFCKILGTKYHVERNLSHMLHHYGHSKPKSSLTCFFFVENPFSGGLICVQKSVISFNLCATNLCNCIVTSLWAIPRTHTHTHVCPSTLFCSNCSPWVVNNWDTVFFFGHCCCCDLVGKYWTIWSF